MPNVERTITVKIVETTQGTKIKLHAPIADRVLVAMALMRAAHAALEQHQERQHADDAPQEESKLIVPPPGLLIPR